MTLTLEIDFRFVPCQALVLTWQPHSAATQTLGNFKKIPIDGVSGAILSSTEKLSASLAEKPTEEPMIRPKRPADTEASCGSCYGAAEDSCCDTCADVFLAYRVRRWQAPMHERVKQCEGVTKLPEIRSPFNDFSTADKHEVDALKQAASQGCRVSGAATVNRSPGTLHASTSGVSRHAWHAVMGAKGSMEHTIRSMSVTDASDDAALIDAEDTLELIVSDDTPSHQYYMTLVSVQRERGLTSYKIIPKYFPVTNDPIGPGVHFRFDFDPLKVVHRDERKLAASLVDWLGYFGGLIALLSIF